MDNEEKKTEIHTKNKRDTDLYFQARDRALERTIEDKTFLIEASKAFQEGIAVAQNRNISPQELRQIVEGLKSETNYAFAFLCGVVSRLEALKGKSYRASWQKRGMSSAFMNLQRKYDRIDNIINLNGEDVGENLTSQLADTAVYSLKMTTFQAETNPEEVVNWLLEVIAILRT